ncbi:MAG: NADP-dependent isocitrate dehydrogenase, partial [Spirochaetales bacterium]|nr:NADP-dependent isocitrate dehydrogenase [Spirochaetales bacterium]
DDELSEIFTPLYKELARNEKAIVEELTSVQGKSVQLDGYYRPSEGKMAELMRPCSLFNGILDSLKA